MFHTAYKTSPSSLQIDHRSIIITLGSCFADVMGNSLVLNKFPVLSNPLGIIYHPIALLELLTSHDLNKDSHFVQREDAWFHEGMHSEMTADSKEELQDMIAGQVTKLRTHLRHCKVVIFTFGTAFHYVRHDNQEMVANCHKLPSSLFRKQLSEVNDIVEKFKKTDLLLKELNPDIQYIVTVSPVRHLKDTLQLNSVSKSILRLACHQVASSIPEAHYFPAYEIMMDDLRDYRFYKEDMIHPSPLAEKYILEKFSQTYFNDHTRHLLEQWAEVLKALEHKPFQPQSRSYKKFLEETIVKTSGLSLYLDTSQELGLLNEKLNQIQFRN